MPPFVDPRYNTIYRYYNNKVLIDKMVGDI